MVPLRKAYPLQTNKRRETTTKKACKQPPLKEFRKMSRLKNDGEKMMISPFEVLAERKGRGVNQAV